MRLGDGTDESKRRIEAARARLWPYTAELFESDAVDDAAEATGLGPRWSTLEPGWQADMKTLFDEARLAPPAAARAGRFRSTGKVGRHSEHMGYVLSELQYLQRTYPGGVW